MLNSVIQGFFPPLGLMQSFPGTNVGLLSETSHSMKCLFCQMIFHTVKLLRSELGAISHVAKFPLGSLDQNMLLS